MATHFGTTSGDAYYYGDINALDGATALTFAIWHYQTAGENTGGGGGASVVVSAKGVNSTLIPWYLFKNDGGGALPKTIGVADGSGNTAYTGNNVISDATWQHLLWTYDGSQSVGSRVKFYVNGALISTAADAMPAAFPSNANQFTLGQVVTTSAWSGTLAHCKVWTRVLTASEVLQECLYAEPQVITNLQIYAPLMFNTQAGFTYDGTNAMGTTNATPTTGTVSEPPVIWPAGARQGHRNNWRSWDALRRNRFQRLSPKRPLVQYG